MRLAFLCVIAVAAVVSTPVPVPAAAAYAFFEIAPGYENYALLNDVASSGTTFINQANRTWLSPDGVVKADQVPLPTGFDKSIGQAINAVHQLTGELMDFGPPNVRVPFVWDTGGGTRTLAGLTEYNASFGPTDPANPRANLAMDLTDDGQRACGYGWSPIGEHPWVAWVWTAADSFRTLPVDAGFFVPQALWIDEPGGTIYGVAQDASAAWHRVKWVPTGLLAAPEEPGVAPLRFVGAPAPNPFRVATAFRIEVPGGATTRVVVRDARGRDVAVLLDGVEGPGPLALAWDGRDGLGRRVSAGCYFIVVDAGGVRAARKILQLP